MDIERKQDVQTGWNSEFIIGILGLGLAAIVYFSTRELTRLGGVFVDYVLTAIFVLSILVIIKGFIRPERIHFFENIVERNNITIGICILLLYLIALPVVGFLPSSYVFYFCFNLYLADERFTIRNICISALLTAVVVTMFYFIFHGFLEVPLPKSMWSN